MSGGANKQLILYTAVYKHSGTLDIFKRQHLALGHVCDHMLTPPENLAWHLVEPGLAEFANPRDLQSLIRVAKSLWTTPLPPAAQLLYDHYARIISEEVPAARKHHWQFKCKKGKKWSTVGMGLRGITCIRVDNNVASAYFSNAVLAPKRKLRYSPEDRQVTPLPRLVLHRTMLPFEKMIATSSPARAGYYMFFDNLKRLRLDFQRNRRIRSRYATAHPSLASGKIPSLDQWQKLRADGPPEPVSLKGQSQ